MIDWASAKLARASFITRSIRPPTQISIQSCCSQEAPSCTLFVGLGISGRARYLDSSPQVMPKSKPYIPYIGPSYLGMCLGYILGARHPVHSRGAKCGPASPAVQLTNMSTRPLEALALMFKARARAAAQPNFVSFARSLRKFCLL